MTRFGLDWWASALLLTVPVACSAQGAKESPKQMVEIAKTMADQCAGLKLVCRAAAMDKKYQSNCDDFKVSLNQSSNRNLASGSDFLAQGKYPIASLYANRVCDYDPELASRKRELLDLIKKAQEPAPVVVVEQKPVAPPKDEVSPVKAAEAERAFASGDFDAATAAAHQVVDKNLQVRTDAILQQIANYRSAMQEGQQKESQDRSGAIQAYKRALLINSHGPGDPGGRVATLERPVPVAPGPKNTVVAVNNPPPPPPPPPGVEAARLIAEARQQESQHNLQQAMRLYEEALRVQKGNPEATAGLNQVRVSINSDPKEQAKVLADAIRAFYGLNYAEAEDDLTSYLSSTTAKYRGAAYFYLGASRLYREILDGSSHQVREAANSAQVQRPFKDARLACYRPIDKYLSPVVLSAWNASSGSATCAH